MTRRRIGIIGMVLLLIASAVWVLLPKHRGSSASVAGGAVTPIPAHGPQVQSAVDSTKSAEPSSLWVRPAPDVAARNSRRFGFAWILRQLGASEEQLDRLADLDVAAVIAELKQKAQNGDAASINILGEIALQNCQLGRDEATVESFVASQIRDARAVPGIDGAWF
jgi:hypothetical protein